MMIAADRIPKDSLVFDPRFKVCDDAFLWIGLSMDGMMVYVDRILGCYRQHETNITADREKYLVDAVFYLEENLARVKDRMNPHDVEALKGRLAGYFSDLGWLYRSTNRSRRSFSACLQAWKWSRSPMHLIHASKAFFPPRSS